MNGFERAPRLQVAAFLFLVLVMVLAISGVSVDAQDIEPTVEPTPVPITVTVTASEGTTDEEPTIVLSGDWALVGLIVGVVFALGGAIYAIHRTGKVAESLGGFVDKLSDNTVLVTTLEQKFSRLKPDEQARLTKLIDVLDPWTKTTANEADDKTLALLRELTDGVPANEKPPQAVSYGAAESVTIKELNRTHYPPRYSTMPDEADNG